MINILIVDDHDIVRDGLKMLISEHEDMVVAGEADNGKTAISLLQKGEWDVVLLDMSMPGRSGTDLIKQIRAEKPKLPVLIISMHKEEQYAARTLQSGASGYLCKINASEKLIDAIRKVVSGGVYVSPAVLEKMAFGIMPNQDVLPHSLLSNREFQVLQKIVSGDNLTMIADNLNLSVKTISTHKTRIMKKLELTNVSQIIRYAIKHNLFDDC